MDGKVHKHIVRIWGAKQPKDQKESGKDNEKVTVWTLTSVNKAFGPSYFASLIVTTTNYKHSMTSHFLSVLLTLSSDTIFQQDGAKPHYSFEVRRSLNGKLPDS